MRTLKIVMLVTSAMMISFLIWNLTLSGGFETSTELDFTQSPSEIYTEMNDLSTWTEWSQNLRRDTNMTIHVSDPSIGERAWVNWKMVEGPGGRMEITKTQPTEIDLMISLQGLDALDSRIQITETESGSKILWSVDGELPFYARFMKSGFEKTVREDFEKSLANLKTYLKDK
ncbi:MAG: SRPBCC family protein [Flavobacteriia bacterium]|nr:SRPBCC family protein [Flavobacteriia bacterium]